MGGYLRGLILLVVVTVASSGLFPGGVGAAPGDTIAVYGGDLTAAERQELAQLFGQGAATTTDTVTAPEVIAAERGTGLPTAATDKAISSAALTCRDKGQGLRVRTGNITRITAATYANALVTAGVGDGDVLIAAPAGNPVTGESGLVGALKAFPQCQGAGQADPNRVRLAYGQLAATVALAGPTGDLNKASTVILRAAQAVITGKATDEATVGAALDTAAAAEGLTPDPAARTLAIANLRGLGRADYGTYAQGYQIQQVSPTEVNVTPSGAGTSAPLGAGTVGTGAAAVTFSGSVTRAGTPLGVRTTDGRDRSVNPAGSLTVIRDGKPTTIADLQPGDRVNVFTDPAGNATRIEATSGGAPVASTAGDTFSGDVTGSGTPLAVRDSGGQPRTVRPAAGLVVVRDGTPSTLADIRVGDRVNVTTGSDGNATRIEASSTAAGGTFTGEATQAGANGTPLAARIDGQDRAFTPAQDVIVTRDGRDARLGDIRAGDTVAVTTNPDGTAARIAATSKPGNPLGFLRWLLPLLLLLGLLALLLFFLGRRRRRDSFILERDTAVALPVEETTTIRTTMVGRDPDDRPRR